MWVSFEEETNIQAIGEGISQAKWNGSLSELLAVCWLILMRVAPPRQGAGDKCPGSSLWMKTVARPP